MWININIKFWLTYVMRVKGAVLCSGLLCYVMWWLYACHFEDGVSVVDLLFLDQYSLFTVCVHVQGRPTIHARAFLTCFY